jgi:hypothetical protein
VSYKVRDQFDSLLSDFDINSFLLLDISFRHDLLDISPTLSEAAGAIVDVSFFLHLLFIVLLFLSFLCIRKYLS